MNYQKAWLELKSMIDGMNKSADNSMPNMAESVWTKSVTSNILGKMDTIEKNMLTQNGLGKLVSLPENKEKITNEILTEARMKNVYLVKFKKSAIMQGRYGALVIVDENKGRIERAIVRETGMLSTSVLSANIESISLIGAKKSSEVKKEVVILTENEYHSCVVHLKGEGFVN